MIPKVHILATILEDNVDAAVFTFKTLRVGFPNCDIVVYGNGLSTAHRLVMQQEVANVDGKYVHLSLTSHGDWLESLVMTQKEPFWICDTDIYFKRNVENWFVMNPPPVFAGTLQKEYYEPWSGTRYQERLHTCLMWMNPSAIRAEFRRWNRQNIPRVFHTGQIPFIQPQWIPFRNGGTMLYDTTAGLWQAGFGTPFTEEQLDAFEHLHAATYATEVSKCPEMKDLAEAHKMIYDKPELANGLRKVQDRFYEQHQQ